MSKKATVTKKTTKPQATKPAKPVKPVKPTKANEPKGKGKNVTSKGNAKKVTPAKATTKVTAQPKNPKITQAPRRTVGIVNDTYYAKGKKLYEIPAESTLKRLKKEGVKRIQYGNGDAILIK